MTIKGKAKVSWDTRDTRGEREQHRGDGIYYLREEAVVLQARRSKHVLKPGVHVYPFLCKLPSGNFPSTFQTGTGKVSYSVIFVIRRFKYLTKTLESEFPFERLVNVNVPELLRPLSSTKSRHLICFWGVSGDVSMDVSVDKKGFVPGETIRIKTKLGNNTSSTAVASAELKRKIIYYTNGRLAQKSESTQVKCVVGEHVQPNTSEFHGEIKLCVPKDVYITLKDCEVLDIEYSLEVNLSVNAFAALTAILPIVIGNSPEPETPETN
ncbi:arrestin domain-containing protein 3-like [Engraulis encrasicolus]|uniref:arrestin domain-containing protein 3-like n=1 Tax=Engraulis encrasicolus TaxID=184585 RepID=UPI002FD6B908